MEEQFRGREDPPNLSWNNENRVFECINIHRRRLTHKRVRPAEAVEARMLLTDAD